MRLSPYISFNGDCAEAFAFYAEVLGGEIEFVQTYGESPIAAKSPPAWKDRVLHVSLRFGERWLLGADAPPEYYSKPQGFSVMVGFDDTEKAAAVFAALAEGGEIRMPFAPTFWTKGFGMLIDRFHIPWMVNGASEENPA